MLAGLYLNPRHVPSPLVDKPVPAFSLPSLSEPERHITPEDFRGHVWLLNVWASWCVSCRAEHPLLVNLLQEETILVGLNYKDIGDSALAWLKQWGNPYRVSVIDADGRVGLDWGVYGVPETFVIDDGGIIRHKHVGVLNERDIVETILPLVRRLQDAASK